MNSLELEQGSEAWRLFRLGKATGSRIADVVAKIKSGWGASRANYAADLVIERLTQTPIEGFKSADMIWGNTYEPEARAGYELMYGNVTLVGFVPHPRIAMSGCSPDGLVEPRGTVQFKCPKAATHIAALRSKKIDGGYYKQVQWELACTERDWSDFVSYHPHMPGEMRLWVKRIQRDKELIDELEREVPIFLDEVTAAVKELEQEYRVAA